MPIYSYDGQKYNLDTSDPKLAEETILKYLEEGNKTVEEPSLVDKNIPALKEMVGEVTALGGVALGAPGFIVQALGTPIQAANQLLSGRELDWEEAKEDATRVAAPFTAPMKAVDYIVDKFNIRDEFNNSWTNKALEGVTSLFEWAGEVVEEKTNGKIPKEAVVAALDVGSLGVGIPGVKAIPKAIERKFSPDVTTHPDYSPITDATTGKAVETKPAIEPVIEGPAIISRPEGLVPEGNIVEAQEGLADAPSSDRPITPEKPPAYSRPDYVLDPDKYVRDTVGIPDLVKEYGVDSNMYAGYTYKAFDDSLYELFNQTKLDKVENINLRRDLEKLGIPIELQEKFRRFDEGQALGTGSINKDIFEINKKINELYSQNSSLFKEENVRSTINPDGTTSWRDFTHKRDVTTNYNKILELRKEKRALEAKRGTKEVLTPVEKALYERYFEPRLTEIKRVSEYLERNNLVPKFGKDPEGAFAPRKAVPKTLQDKTLSESYKEALVGKDFTHQGGDVNNTPAGGMERAYFALEAPNGGRSIWSVNETPKGTTLLELREGKVVNQLDLPKDIKVKAGEKVGDKTVREASLEELELNTNRKYLKDYSLVLGERLTELREQARIHEFTKKILADKELSWKPENKFDKVPEGFERLQYTDKMPELDGYYFPERIAEILNDFNKPFKQDVVTKINNGLVTNMMLLPFIHMHNEIFHWGLTKGASGFLNPKKLLGFKGLPDAIKEVVTRGDFYKELLREGGSMMSTNVKVSTFMDEYYKKNLNQFKDSTTFKSLAKAMGRKPADLYAGISKWSNKSMWTVRDILYVQLIKDKMAKGLTMKEAINRVERHMPSYRLPSRLISDKKAGRVISRALGNRHAFLFARYHAGMLGSAKNTIKDLLMLDPSIKKSEQFKEGVDSSLAAALAMAIIYPLIDDVAGVIVDVLDADGRIDPDSIHVRRPGIAHVFDSMYRIAKHEKDPYSLASLLVTPTPVLSSVFETAWNYELYNRKEIRTPGADLEVQGDQYLQYLMRKVPQAGNALRATGDYGTGTTGIFIRNFLDIQAKSPEQVEQIEDQVERRESHAENVNDEYEGLFLRRP